MNSPTVFSLGRLSLGVSRISIRHGHATPRYKQPRPDLTRFEPGHGEQIWIFQHFMSNQIVYSHKPVMKSNRAHKQLPFTAKKMKPAKLRKDYWRPMALIQFAEGAGLIGQSVFQKLRELRTLHEVSWGHQAAELLNKSRQHERAIALNDQQANAIADVAAVLGGAGRGNKMWIAEGGGEGEATGQDAPMRLAEATVHWASPQDVEFAKEWTANVTHTLGLPETTRKPVTSEAGAIEEPLQHEAITTA